VYSIATFALEAVDGKTKLTFTQHGVPDDAAAHIATGWHERYWKPLQTYLASQ